MNQPKFKLGMTNPETMIIPSTILIPTNEADSVLNFNYRFLHGHLDFQTNSLQVVFEGNFSQQFTMANAKQYDFDRSKDTYVLKPAVYNTASHGKISEIILTVSPTTTTVDAKTLFGKRYLLATNIHHTPTPKKPVKRKASASYHK